MGLVWPLFGLGFESLWGWFGSGSDFSTIGIGLGSVWILSGVGLGSVLGRSGDGLGLFGGWQDCLRDGTAPTCGLGFESPDEFLGHLAPFRRNSASLRRARA